MPVSTQSELQRFLHLIQIKQSFLGGKRHPLATVSTAVDTTNVYSLLPLQHATGWYFSETQLCTISE